MPDRRPPLWVVTAAALLYQVDRRRWSPLVADIRRQRYCVRLGGHYWHTAFAEGSATPVCYLCSTAMR